MAAKNTASTNTDSKNIMPEKTMPKNNRISFSPQPFITQRCGECSVNERIFC